MFYFWLTCVCGKTHLFKFIEPEDKCQLCGRNLYLQRPIKREDIKRMKDHG